MIPKGASAKFVVRLPSADRRRWICGTRISHMNQNFKVLYRKVLGAVLLSFLAGQWAALAHESEHPFHHDEAGCGLYLHVDHQNPALLTPPPSPVTPATSNKPQQTVSYQTCTPFVLAYAIRAPPHFF